MDLKLAPQFLQCLPAKMGVDEVCGFRELRGRNSRRQFDDPVFDLVVITDQHGKRLRRLKPYELDMLQYDVVFGGQHQSGTTRHAR